MAQKEIAYDGHRFAISYEMRHLEKSRDIVFLHGWGSNKELMAGAFGNCLSAFRHIYIDMPGFGKSPNDVVLSTQDYAAILKQFLQEIGVAQYAIAGHSFGGKVATLLAPEFLILMATSGIVVAKPFGVRFKIATYKLLKRLGLGSLRSRFASADGKDLNEAMYETFKNVVDEDFTEHFATCKSKTLLLWGIEDTATPIATAHEIHHLISGSTLFECSGDHYFFLKQRELTCEKIEAFLGRQ